MGRSLEEMLRDLFSHSELPFREGGLCPACQVEKGIKHEIKVIAMLDAEARGWPVIGAGEGALDYVQMTDLQLLYCTESAWRGYLSLDELERKLRFELERDLQPWKRR